MGQASSPGVANLSLQFWNVSDDLVAAVIK